MKLKLRTIALTGALSLLLAGTAGAQGPPPGRRGPRPAPIAAAPGVYTTVSGTIAQLNYNRDAMPEGLLLNDKTLVHLPPNAAPLIGPTLKPGDTVEIAGFANTTVSGLKTVEAQEVKDRTSGKTFAMPQPGPAAPYSGSGRIQQLNYGPDGAVNGFLLDNGTLAELPPFSAANPSSIRPGVAVSFTGYARTTITGRTVVDLQTVSINGQSLIIGAAGPGAGPLPQGPPLPPTDGQADEPPPPPPPPAVPNQ